MSIETLQAEMKVKAKELYLEMMKVKDLDEFKSAILYEKIKIINTEYERLDSLKDKQ